MLALATIFLTTLFSAVAQQPPETPGGPPPQQQATGPMPAQPPLNSGYCLDSLRQVPKVIVAPVATGAQIVRIDLILSTASLTPNEVIGFLYTTEDGSHVARSAHRRLSVGRRRNGHQSGAGGDARAGLQRDRIPAKGRLRRTHQASAALPGSNPSQRLRPAANQPGAVRRLAGGAPVTRPQPLI